MRAAMMVKRPSRDWSADSATYVQVAFDAEAEKEDEDEEDMTDAGGKGKQRKAAGDHYQQLSIDASKGSQSTVDALTAAKMKISDAWKGAN